jgi:hypothetical protein
MADIEAFHEEIVRLPKEVTNSPTCSASTAST